MRNTLWNISTWSDIAQICYPLRSLQSESVFPIEYALPKQILFSTAPNFRLKCNHNPAIIGINGSNTGGFCDNNLFKTSPFFHLFLYQSGAAWTVAVGNDQCPLPGISDRRNCMIAHALEGFVDAACLVDFYHL